MDAFLVLVQTGRDGDWTDEGLPEVVSGQGRPTKLREAALDWLGDARAAGLDDNWRLLAWKLSDKSYDRADPDVVINATDAQAHAAGLTRSGPRLRRRAGRVVAKVPAGQELLGLSVLVTQRADNNSAVAADGPWFPASRPTPDAVAARVRSVAEVERGGRQFVRLSTALGEIGWMPMGHGVIPVDD